MKEKKKLPSFLTILIGVLFVNTFIVGISYTTGPSMQPTISNNTVLVQHLFYNPKRGDIVDVFAYNIRMCKRIVGMPNDEVYIKEDGIYINNKLYDDKFPNAYMEGLEYVGKPIKLQKDEYFVIGDNREQSEDSRVFGPIKRLNIIGHIIWIF